MSVKCHYCQGELMDGQLCVSIRRERKVLHKACEAMYGAASQQTPRQKAEACIEELEALRLSELEKWKEADTDALMELRDATENCYAKAIAIIRKAFGEELA